jgi:hypothetical protein
MSSGSSHIQDDRAALQKAGSAAVQAASQSGVTLRLLGGVAVALRCPSARGSGPLARDYSDLDFATTRKQVKGTIRVMKEQGYIANERFNSTHGESRLMFAEPSGRHIDVFVDRFTLCHELPLRERLDAHETTLSLADLLLTKLQVAKLSRKDVTDAAALLLDHPLADGADGIDPGRIVELLAGDWGWWRTSTETIDRLREVLGDLPLDDTQRERVRSQLDELSEHIEAAPKSLRWKARARIGDRRPWREDPDDMEA